MSDIANVLREIEEFEKSPEGQSFDLRLDLADILLRHLDGKKWTQAKLAEQAGMLPPALTRIVHATQNCTFDVAARLALALGIKVKLVEVADSARKSQEQEHGHQEVIKQGSTSGNVAVAVSFISASNTVQAFRCERGAVGNIVSYARQS